MIDKEATELETGSRHEECTVCDYKKEAVEIPATGTEGPQTGETTNQALWFALLFVSCGGVIGGTVLKSKKGQKEQGD